MYVCVCVCFTLGNNAESWLSSDDVDRDDCPVCSSTDVHYTSVNEVSGHEWQAVSLDTDPKSISSGKSTLERHSAPESSVPQELSMHIDAPGAGRLHVT